MRAVVAAELLGDRLSIVEAVVEDTSGPWVAGYMLASDGARGPRFQIDRDRVLIIVEVPPGADVGEIVGMVGAIMGIAPVRHSAHGPAQEGAPS